LTLRSIFSCTWLHLNQLLISALEEQMAYFKSTNTNLLDRLADFSVVNQAGAETIKKSLEALGYQNKYIKDLTASLQRKDSLNLSVSEFLTDFTQTASPKPVKR
jgi:Holliday junction resolvasome RuvABC DNA-binding subunit